VNNQPKWWQSAVFYQIYPRSFADGNGDGIGDFRGMIKKLDYLKDLGIDAIWLSPHFPSPYIDCGYDVSDYRGVAPEYGTLEQFKEFLTGAHDRGIRLVLDLVLNHTSDKHAWFEESRQDKTNPKRDWYIWKPAHNGGPPNNWYSTFGGSAWELDPSTNEYYYHYFFKEQPDLNWKNPAVQEAMFNEARFWLDMGVDGFRLDAVGTIFEDERYIPITGDMTQEKLFRLSHLARTPEENAKVVEHWMEMFHYQVDQPEVHQVTRDLRKVIDEYEDRVLIGETDDIAFYGKDDDELHLNFNFPLMRTSVITAEHVRSNQDQRLAALPREAWPCNTFGNHDSSRVFSNYGDGKNNEIQAKLYLMLLLCLKGTPFLYNGEEIGMSDYLLMDAGQYKDPLGLLFYDMAKNELGLSEEEAIRIGSIRGRDKCRTPIQWSKAPNGGFSPEGVTPWLPVNPNFVNGVNVEEQQEAPESLWRFYQRMLHLRKDNQALSHGEYRDVKSGIADVMIIERSYGKEIVTAILNLSSNDQKLHNEGHPYSSRKVILSNIDIKELENNSGIHLLPYQGVIYE
jgi:alpha-glucosidase